MRPEQDNTRRPVSDPHIRYVQVDSINLNSPAVSSASNASPIVIGTTAAHGFSTGDQVVVSGVTGDTAANGTFTITVIDSDHFSLNGSTGSGSYVSDGAVKLAQPMKVKLLKWDSSTSDYATYGGAFGVGGVEAAYRAGVGQRFFIAWRPDAQRWEPIDLSENCWLVRGQSYGAQSGATILIDAVIPLAGGLDPTLGDPSALVTVSNTFDQSYADNELVDAAHSPDVVPGVADWEALKTTTGTDKYRLIRGNAFGNVDGDDETFDIDGIVILAGGLDPRSVAGDMAETLTITNQPGETFFDNEPVVAIYNEAEAGWEVLAVERYRACKGDYYSTTDATHIVIENVEPLGSGLCPIVDESGHLTVVKESAQTYTSGDVVRCDFNDPTEEWEARPKAGSGSGKVTGLYRVDADIDPRDNADITLASPGLSSDVTLIEGDAGGEVANWALVPVETGSIILTVELGGHNVIYTVLC